jgi:NAD-dependent dihydropyrimidine dehydrogenase PreA subunit
MPAVVDKDKCDGCKTCEPECPTESIKVTDGKAEVIVEECIDCNACESACPTGAVKVES